MSNWTPMDWSMFFVALGTLVGTVLSAVAALMANLARIKSEANGKSIEDNTVLTKKGTAAATQNAKVAAEAASAASDKADTIVDQLNGKLDQKITNIVNAHTDPIVKMMKAHTEQYDKNMMEIRAALEDLAKFKQR